MNTHTEQIATEHVLIGGFCRCGMTGRMLEDRHAQHVRELQASAQKLQKGVGR